MLLPSPEIQKRLDTYQTIDKMEANILKQEWNRQKRRRNFILRTFAGLAILGAGVTAYNQDVAHNQQIQAEASIDVLVRGQALDPANSNKGIFFIDGFGTSDANKLAEYMAPAVQPVFDGQILSVDLNNATLSTEQTADKIIEAAKEQGITSLAAVGYSAGGNISVEVQQEIRDRSNLPICLSILVSTPDGVAALRPARQAEIALIESVAWIPGIEHSTPLRFLGEMALRADRYNDGKDIFENVGNFFETAGTLTDEMNSNALASTQLLFSQELAIEKSDLKAQYEKSGTTSNKIVDTTTVYLGTTKNKDGRGHDYIVNNELSSENIGTYNELAGLPFFTYDIPGAVHSRIEVANDQYIKILGNAAPELQASMKAQDSITQLYRIPSKHDPIPIKSQC